MEITSYEVAGWGVGELWLEEGRLVYHELPRVRTTSARRGDHPLARRFRAYFAGARDDFADVELDLEWCTPFQRAVVDAAREVAYGETVTYGGLAARAGFPRAHRAAGTVCAHNRFGLVVPCHRIVAAGSLGAYGPLGSAYKRRLQELERGLPRSGGASPVPTENRTRVRSGAELARPVGEER